MSFDVLRSRKLNQNKDIKAPVIYWMSRDQRVDGNWALVFAQNLALQHETSLVVVFNLVDNFLKAGLRHYDFMLCGLEEVEQSLTQKNISFRLLQGLPEKTIPDFIKKNNCGALITDFSPLKTKQNWNKKILQNIKIPFFEVDAHNIVPVWQASPKLEFAAYTLRPKIHKQLDLFLTDFEEIKMQQKNDFKIEKVDWQKVKQNLKVDTNIKPVDWIKPGQKKALETLNYFLKNKLNNYSKDRNDPNKKAVSDLSPYLHYGHICSQQIVLEIQKMKLDKEIIESFIEELVVRKELADNFCFYNLDYDNFEGFHTWAKTTLNEHTDDKREFIYTLEHFEKAQTHDDLWNAAQVEMVETGKMHGFMRMYWAKKILEWTTSPEEALHIAIYLNDKYSLDGRDPNGYAGIAWSIGGIHDRAWNSRPVFGKIRYMNYNGCKRKFDIKSYIQKYTKDISSLF
jgi:deoxyribodipyrimidine photo-lyase